MAKKSRNRARPESSAAEGASAPGAVGPRQPCPCGSGKRYKACHGAPGGAAAPFVARPFEGLAGECDIIAMRELVPAATAPLALKDGGSVRVCTLLPGASPALVRESGDIWLGLQVVHNFGDPSRDLAAVLEAAQAQAARGEEGVVGLPQDPGAGPRLQDLASDGRFEVTVHDGFGYWLDDVAERDETMDAVLQQANDNIHPTAKLTSVPSAYWTDVGPKEHLRWVLPHDEDVLLSALARLHAAGQDTLVEGSRLVGMFRAHGLLTPVWDLEPGTGAEALEEPVTAFAAALEQALADSSDLSAEERAARAGLANRQVTIR